jgi:hypothetical protein
MQRYGDASFCFDLVMRDKPAFKTENLSVLSSRSSNACQAFQENTDLGDVKVAFPKYDQPDRLSPR